jgi:hypothetical protein
MHGLAVYDSKPMAFDDSKHARIMMLCTVPCETNNPKSFTIDPNPKHSNTFQNQISIYIYIITILGDDSP